jgi:hypothetical protein
MSKSSMGIALCAATFLLGGCAKFDAVKLEQVTQPPLTAKVTTTSIEVTDGTAVAIFVEPFRGARELDPDDVRITVDNERVAVWPVTKDTAADYNGTWIVTGVSPGQAELIISLDLHDGEVRIPVTVTPQAADMP